jgi:hypothetical protein
MDFDLTLPGLEPTIYRSRDEHVWWRSNSINTIVIDFDLTLPGLEPTILRIPEIGSCLQAWKKVRDIGSGEIIIYTAYSVYF